MALGIVKYFYDHISQPIGVIWFEASLFAVSCRGPAGRLVGSKRKQALNVFSRTKRRIASSGIESVVSDFSIIKPMLYQLSSSRRSVTGRGKA